MFSKKLLKFIKKIVALITAFCGGVSLVFLISGTGEALLRLLFCVVLFVSAINLAVYVQETAAEKAAKSAPPQARQPSASGGGNGQGGGGRPGGDRQK